MARYNYTGSSNHLSGANKRRTSGFNHATNPSAVDDDLKQAILFGLSLKKMTTFDALFASVRARGVIISESQLGGALEKMKSYGAVENDNDEWKRRR